MTPEQYLRREVLERAREWLVLYGYCLPDTIDENNVDDVYNGAIDNSDAQGCICDADNEVREGQFETQIEPEYNQYYSAKSVGMECQGGVLVGWTYLYGGGKHADPSGEDWMDEAYFIKLSREEAVVVRYYEKID